MKRLILIDLSSLAHPIWHTSGQDADVDATSRRTVERVRALASGQPHVAICCDSGKSFRKDIDPDYKGNRPPAEAALHHQIGLAKDILRHDGFPLWEVPNFEADDVIASAVKVALERYSDVDAGEFEIVICSSDKDLLQLVGPRVQVHSLASGKEYTESMVLETFKVSPNQFVDYQALVGDTADNIKGAKGIGAKKAGELLSKYGNLEDLFAALTSNGTAFTPGLATNLREFQPRMDQVRQLVRLRGDAPIPFDEVERERQEEDAVFASDDEEPAAAPGAAVPAAAAPAAAPTPAPVASPPPAAPVAAAPAPSPQPSAPTPVAAPAPPASSTNGNGPAKVAEVVAGGAPPAVSTSTAAALKKLEDAQKGSGLARPAAPDTIALRDEPAAAPGEWDRQLEPRSMAQAKSLALDMFQAKLFAGYGNPAAVLATILAGREFGLSASASLRAFDIIDGKQSMKADLIRALILRSGKTQYFRCTERSAEAATFKTKRVGDGEEEIILRFTIAEGKLAFQGDDSKWAKTGWGKNPADMLVARAGAKLARLVYPDVVHGLYSPEELEG